jgi:hypothetical protein
MQIRVRLGYSTGEQKQKQGLHVDQDELFKEQAQQDYIPWF